MLVEQDAGRFGADRLGVGPLVAGPQDGLAVEGGQQDLERHGAVGPSFGQRAAGKVAAAAQLAEEGALGVDGPVGGGSSIAASRNAASGSSARHSTARAPWATWGSMTDGSSTSVACSPIPSRSSAAMATTTASRSAALATRVSMLPRIDSKRRSGRRAAS